MSTKKEHNGTGVAIPKSEKKLKDVLDNLENFLDRFQSIELDPIFKAK